MEYKRRSLMTVIEQWKIRLVIPSPVDLPRSTSLSNIALSGHTAYATSHSLSEKSPVTSPNFVQQVIQNDESDEVVFEQLIRTIKTLQEQLFFVCTLPNDSGKHLLEGLLDRLDQDVNKYRDISRNNGALMHICAKYNNVECMELLQSRGAEIDPLDETFATPLFYACARNSKDAAMFLLSHGSNPNHKDRYGGHPLSVCLRNYHLDMIEILTLFNADIHAKGTRGNTCLHLAVAEGNTDKVSFLVNKCNASIKRTNRDDEHSLFTALSNPEMTKHLMSLLETRDLRKILSMTNSFGKTVFHVCAENGYLESLQIIMLEYNHREENRRQTKEFLTSRLNESDNRLGLTPLHHSVINNQLEMIVYLCSIEEIDVNMKDNQGNTALHHSLFRRDQATSNLLIKFGASVKTKNHESQSAWGIAYHQEIHLETKQLGPLDRFILKRSVKKSKLKKLDDRTSHPPRKLSDL